MNLTSNCYTNISLLLRTVSTSTILRGTPTHAVINALQVAYASVYSNLGWIVATNHLVSPSWKWKQKWFRKLTFHPNHNEGSKPIEPHTYCKYSIIYHIQTNTLPLLPQCSYTLKQLLSLFKCPMVNVFLHMSPCSLVLVTEHSHKAFSVPSKHVHSQNH